MENADYILNYTLNKKMDSDILASKIQGNWIIQSTTYSLLKKQVITSYSKTNWKLTSNNYIKKLLRGTIEKYSIDNSSVYILESQHIGKVKKLYNFFLYNQDLNQGQLFKLNNNGDLINKSDFIYKNSKHICINYEIDGFFVNENIFFVNKNLKIIKSIVKKNKICIGISFSSEIRMS